MELKAEWTGDPESGEEAVIWVNGDITIQNAEELKGAIISAFACTEEVVLNISGVTAIDISFLQVVWSSYSYAARTNRRFHMGGVFPEPVARAIVDVGEWCGQV